MTAEEFEDCIWDLKLTLDDIWEKTGDGSQPHWLLSIDSDSAHTRARLQERGIWAGERLFPLAFLSPDMHKVVEHVHAWLTKKMHAWLRSRAADKPTPRQCMMQCKEFFSQYPRASIQADVDSMQATYAAIQQQAGMYPAAKFR